MEIWGGPTGLIPVPGFEDIVQLSVQSRDLLLHNEKALTADNAWSNCMATHGYTWLPVRQMGSRTGQISKSGQRSVSTRNQASNGRCPVA